MATKANTETAATAETPAATGAPVPVVVEARPLEPGAPTPEGRERAEFMRRHNHIREWNERATSLALRLEDSGLAFYDDNVANKRYIAAIDEDADRAPTGSPLVQLQRRPFPAEDALAGVLVYRKDGTSFSIPAGVRSLGDVVDPDSGEPLVGKIDTKKHKARFDAFDFGGEVTLKPDGTVEAKESKK